MISLQISNHKHQNSNNPKMQNTKQYDLEDRSLLFAKSVRKFVKLLPRTVANIEDGKQLTRSSGSVGANYIEANESLSKKDFMMRIKICRKEAKESKYWLNLLDVDNGEKSNLINEASQLVMIFSSIINKSK